MKLKKSQIIVIIGSILGTCGLISGIIIPLVLKHKQEAKANKEKEKIEKNK